MAQRDRERERKRLGQGKAFGWTGGAVTRKGKRLVTSMTSGKLVEKNEVRERRRRRRKQQKRLSWLEINCEYNGKMEKERLQFSRGSQKNRVERIRTQYNLAEIQKDAHEKLVEKVLWRIWKTIGKACRKKKKTTKKTKKKSDSLCIIRCVVLGKETTWIVSNGEEWGEHGFWWWHSWRRDGRDSEIHSNLSGHAETCCVFF